MTPAQLFARLQVALDRTIEYGAKDLRDAGHPFGDEPPKGSLDAILFDAHYKASRVYIDAIRAARRRGMGADL
jgi:hypothetical protein